MAARGGFAPMRLVGALAGALATLLRTSLIAATAAMLGAIFYQVVMRYFFLRAPAWSEELAVLMFSWATLGGLALGVREGFHVALTLLPEQLPSPARRGVAAATELLVAALGAYLAWSGMRFLDITGGSTSAAMEYPIEILNVMAPIAGALIFVFALERLLLGTPAQAAAS
jgi:TRAP-type C4-dicarboxylate transport system permease small subunit